MTCTLCVCVCGGVELHFSFLWLWTWPREMLWSTEREGLWLFLLYPNRSLKYNCKLLYLCTEAFLLLLSDCPTWRCLPPSGFQNEKMGGAQISQLSPAHPSRAMANLQPSHSPYAKWANKKRVVSYWGNTISSLLQNWLIKGKSCRRRTYVLQDCSSKIIFSRRDLCMCYMCLWIYCSSKHKTTLPQI